jgi:hypothetical protein
VTEVRSACKAEGVKAKASVICDCGKEKDVLIYHLTSGKTLSCGCLGREHRMAANTKHGKTPRGKRSRIYRVWSNMLQRCNNPDNPSYHQYGAIGITVCDEWLTFENFYKDVGDQDDPKMSLDRIDSRGPYAPDNVRWATAKQQARNMVTNRLLTLNGVSKCVAEWAEELGISTNVINARINQMQWDPVRALTTPVRKLSKRKTASCAS